ncbi:MAG: hypothetical protein QF721_00145 [Verrucomicrobiota bacterium]|jgi:hypothetical protein|nr:hypothetical protein [Verrucomicrobiota bacterium]MDP7047839.1 hypothetical protein [Verrucomicrobiota bacterium]
MGLFRPNDPLASRAKRLKARLADVESRIEELGQTKDQPAVPPAALHELKPGDEPLPPRPSHPLSERPLGTAEPENESVWQWLSSRFRKPPVSSNPRMVNFLAAGSIQGLRPLRYERRVARNRFLAFSVLLVLVLIGLFWTLLQQ